MSDEVNPITNITGLLRIRIIRGINLPIRDVKSSDPYVIVSYSNQNLKTRIVKKSVNPEWNEDLTLHVVDPNAPIKLFVYDHDTFTPDDTMGDAEFDVKTFLEVAKMKTGRGLPNGATIAKVNPTMDNCIVEESNIVWMDGKVTQNMFLRLRNVESGEIELRLQWIDIQNSISVSPA